MPAPRNGAGRETRDVRSEVGLERGFRIHDDRLPAREMNDEIGTQPPVFGFGGDLAAEVAVVHHARHLDHALQLDFAPASPHDRFAQRVAEVLRFTAERFRLQTQMLEVLREPAVILAARLFELLPNPPLTTGQVDLLKSDNLASGSLPGFRDLGVEPRSVAEIVPTYIGP